METKVLHESGQSQVERPRGPFKRVLLKLSGEAFCAEERHGFTAQEVDSIARQLKDVADSRVQLAVVVGGGNFIRGEKVARSGITKSTADYMGMLATVINALALQDVLESLEVATRVQTAISMERVAEPFIRRRAIRHLEKGRVVIFAGGTGNPHFTTDTTAALRAAEIGADVLMKATKVDGVFDSDPVEHPDARFFDRLSYMDVLNMRLRVMDSTAITLCMEQNMPIIIFNLKEEGNIVRAIRGENIGTFVGK